MMLHHVVGSFPTTSTLSYVVMVMCSQKVAVQHHVVELLPTTGILIHAAMGLLAYEAVVDHAALTGFTILILIYAVVET